MESNSQESRVILALQALKNDPRLTTRRIAKIYFVPRITVKGEDSEECDHEYQDNQESNVGCILITKLNAEVL
jgi:hypothetical protein